MRAVSAAAAVVMLPKALFLLVVAFISRLNGASTGEFEAYPSFLLQTNSARGSCDLSRLSLVVDADFLSKQIEELAAFSDTPAPSVTRILYTENDIAARKYIKDAMVSAGLTVREDAIGNIFGRWEGTDGTSAVGTGSHVDAIPHSGKYDGVVGVLGAIVAIRTLSLKEVCCSFPLSYMC